MDRNYNGSGQADAHLPTGGLIAVIGDDNDDFIFIGKGHDFVAQRDGVLFLGIKKETWLIIPAPLTS
jgi:hypothetical protein